MEPNTDQLCLCLHSACQARYQRVMDANPETVKKREEESKEKEVGSRLVYNAVISLRPLATNFSGYLRKREEVAFFKDDTLLTSSCGQLEKPTENPSGKARLDSWAFLI